MTYAGMTNMHETGEWPDKPLFGNVLVVHNVATGDGHPVGSRLRSQAQRDGASAGNVAMVTMELANGSFVTVWADGTIQVASADRTADVNYYSDGHSIARHDTQPQASDD